MNEDQDQDDYAASMLEAMSTIIEETGKDDKLYDPETKALDVLEVLESLLAYAIYSTCISPETIRDSAEESFVNVKRKALLLLEKYPIDDDK